MAERLVPDRNKMAQYLERGLTQDQIVDAWVEDGGRRVTRNAISLAMKRYGLVPVNPAHRWRDEVPWRVREIHNDCYELKMLRYLGRRNAGLPIEASWNQRLDAWLRDLDALGAVVMYDPRHPKGFQLTHRIPEDGDGYIRRPENLPDGYYD